MYLKCCLTGHWNSEPSLLITMPSTQGNVNRKTMLNHSWMGSRCLLARVPSHIVRDCGTRETLRKSSLLRHPLDSEFNYIIIDTEPNKLGNDCRSSFLLWA